MSKRIFFLVAMPRSGNTLLSAILNQNPDIACTANSITLDALGALKGLKRRDSFLNYPDHRSLDNVMSAVYQSYYSHWPQPYIIDRSPVTHPRNLALVQQHLQQPLKCIVLQRDLLDVLASFVKWFETEPTSFVNHLGWNSIEEKLLALMNQEGAIANGAEAIYHAHTVKQHCLFLKYDDLVQDTATQIHRIYDFLELPRFEHQLDNIGKFELNGMAYDDRPLGQNMHTLRASIEAETNPYKKLIPKSIVERFGHVRF